MYLNNYVDSELSYQCLDDTNSFGEYDSIFGIKRNQQKKAEKKIKKAEKQLAKGHVKAAERKLGKGTKILNQIQQDQNAIQSAQQQVIDVQSKRADLAANIPAINESMRTPAGQIGDQSGGTTMSSLGANMQTESGVGGGGGGAGDVGDSDMSSLGTPETSTEGNPKELSGVTVKSGKPNWILIGGAIVAVIVLIVVFLKSKKK